jgi:hypothetical protein
MWNTMQRFNNFVWNDGWENEKPKITGHVIPFSADGLGKLEQ